MFISISYFGFLLCVLIVTLILFIGSNRIQLL
uniref:Cytochrome b6-f complex subunit 6 n=1 Tax=Lygodium microphyllum TaxID=148566 RepID=A0A345HHK6_9MONI|nr:cytochrome b6/f complex subunit VI [Lygodium microphyllum]AXG76096.1 cytochrome b6/f complex subunit VI [Lygodium microphyllum]